MVGPADYVLRAGRVGVLKREHQRRLSALTRLARSIGAAPHGCGSCNRSVGHKNYFPPDAQRASRNGPTTLRAPAQQIVFRVYKRKPTQTPAPRHETRALLHRPVTGPHAHAPCCAPLNNHRQQPQPAKHDDAPKVSPWSLHRSRSQTVCLPSRLPPSVLDAVFALSAGRALGFSVIMRFSAA